MKNCGLTIAIIFILLLVFETAKWKARMSNLKYIEFFYNMPHIKIISKACDRYNYWNVLYPSYEVMIIEYLQCYEYDKWNDELLQ